MVEGKKVKSYKTLTFSQIWHTIAKRILKKKPSQSIKITQHMKIFEARKRQRVTLGSLLNLGLTLVKLFSTSFCVSASFYAERMQQHHTSKALVQRQKPNGPLRPR